MQQQCTTINHIQIRLIAAGISKWEHSIRKWGVSFLIGEDTLFDAFGDAERPLKAGYNNNCILIKPGQVIESQQKGVYKYGKPKKIYIVSGKVAVEHADFMAGSQKFRGGYLVDSIG